MRTRRRPFPFLPGPYQAQQNLPTEMRQLPMVLLRSGLYPKYKQVTKEAIAEYHSKASVPYAILQSSYGPFDRPVGGMIGASQEQARLRHLQETARQTQGAPDTRPFQPTPPPLPNVADRVYASVPGYNVPNVPFYPRLMPAPAHFRMGAALENAPYTVGSPPPGGTSQQAQQKVEMVKRQINQFYHEDPIRTFARRPNTWWG